MKKRYFIVIWSLAALALLPAAAQSPGTILTDCVECGDMVVLPGGEFLMGSDPDGAFLPEEEQPQHRVSIRSFAIGRYEITQAQWMAVMDDNLSATKGLDLPVQRVARVDALEFITRLNARTGVVYRLPTEAEWEYAARAGSTGSYAFGDDATQLGNYAWFGGAGGNSDGTAHPVGQKWPNPFGLYDTYGNVWEWTEDCYVGNYANAPRDGSAVEASACGPVADITFVYRGGSGSNVPDALRSASRRKLIAVFRSADVGLRIARSLP